jgi:hypothetical protein
MDFVSAENISKTRAAKARRWLWNRGIVSKYDKEEKTFSVLITKHGRERCVEWMYQALEFDR